MESARAFIAISFLIVGIVNGFRINNGDLPVDGAGGVSEIVERDEAVAPSVASLLDSLLVAELKRIIEDQKASGNEESLERISRQAPPEPEKPNQPETPTDVPSDIRFRQCYFNPISCFKK